jgi:hypothetical protein
MIRDLIRLGITAGLGLLWLWSGWQHSPVALWRRWRMARRVRAELRDALIDDFVAALREAADDRGECPACHRERIKLKADGRLRAHHDPDGRDCPGADHLPAPLRPAGGAA